MSKCKTKILSIDGGGVRGIVSACMLKQLELKLGAPIQKHFDYITGTSIGGIIATALSIPDENGNFKYNATYMCDYLSDNAQKIFGQGFFNIQGSANWFSFGGMIRAKHDRSALDNLLEEQLSNYKLSDAKIPISIHALQLGTNTPITWDTFSALSNKDQDFYLKDIAGATSAAPTYFDPKNINGHFYVDGGLFANDPIIPGVAEIMAYDKSLSKADMAIVSIGTGISDSSSQKDANYYWGAGAFQWMFQQNNIIDIMFQASQNLHYLKAMKVFPCYYKLQPVIHGKLPELDDSSSINIQNLKEIGKSYAKQYIENHPELLAILNVENEILGNHNSAYDPVME